MNRFVILRVSVEVLPGGGAARRESWDRSTVVGSADTLKACRALVAEMQRGQTMWHYYGVELVLAGDPARRTPAVVRRPVRVVRRKSAPRDNVVVSIEEGRRLVSHSQKEGADGGSAP